jgi:hypothetical protein
MPEPISPSAKNAILVDSTRFNDCKQNLLVNKRTDFEGVSPPSSLKQDYAMGASKALELDFCYISVGQPFSVAKAKV